MIKRIEQSFDLVVVGGGLAGVCAAIAGARHGLKTCLVHERPVLGGVASSEMRVTVHGAGCHHAWGRETGIISEILSEERARNHEVINENGWTNSVFDQTLYDLVQQEENLTLHLNSPVVRVLLDGAEQVESLPNTDNGYYERSACAPSKKIIAVVAQTQSAEVELTLRGEHFVDATGDGMIADRAGCGWRMGAESRDETKEPHASAEASTDTMGNSIHIRAKDIGRPAPFTPPSWAELHHDAGFFYEQGRRPTDPRGGYWWIEIGIPWHTIFDNETIRHELTRHALGVWDWMKNHDPVMKERCKNYALDFVGQVPGKRESRRIYGRHWLTENELQARTKFPDTIAHGGWFVDLHTPGGLLAPTSEPAAAEGYQHDSEYAASSHIGPYGIPLRSLMARDVDNLFMAGRCLSTTRAALGTVRVMGTTALMGQAVGTAAALIKERNIDLPTLAEDAAQGGDAIRALQQTLLRDGVFLPGIGNQDAQDLAQDAKVTASSSGLLYGQSPTDPTPFAQPQDWPPTKTALKQVQAQNIWCGNGRIDQVELCFEKPGDQAADVPVKLVRIDGVWDYRRGGAETLAEGVMHVSPGSTRWASWRPALSGLGTGWLRIEIGPIDSEVQLLNARGVLPGHNAYRHLSPTRVRGIHRGIAFRVQPPQPAFTPDQVISGVTRPEQAPNQWRSDSGQGLPQWLGLAWDSVQAIKHVEITFPGQVLREVHCDEPFYREPQVARDYSIECDPGDSTWEEVVCVEGNYSWRRIHKLPVSVKAKRLRVVITATNGDPAAGITEIRCY